MDHDKSPLELLLIYSCCLFVDKTHILMLKWASPFRTILFLLNMALLLGILGLPSRQGLSSLWSSIAHLVNQSMGDSHLSSQSLRSYYLQIRSRLGL